MNRFMAGLIVVATLFPRYAEALRSDVLVVVNDNSTESIELGNYYAQRRGIDPSRIVHVRMPVRFYIDWTTFKKLRDQILRLGLCPTVPAGQRPAACSDVMLPM